MRMLSRTILALALFANTLIVKTLPAAESCHVINASSIGQFTFTGPASGITEADLIGGGLLQGTETGDFAFNIVFPTVSNFGPVTYTTRLGTLITDVVGTVDLLTGALTATAVVTGGTGKLAGASGSLSIVGVENVTPGDPNFGAFTATITGQICVDLSKKN